MAVRAILFDFDGTLADSFVPIASSTNYVRGTLGLPPMTVAEIRNYVGLGLAQLMADLAPGLPFEEAIALYSRHHETVMLKETVLLPGVREATTALKSRGYILGVCSNKRVEFTKKLLEMLELAPLMSATLGPDDVGVPKPNPAMLFEAMRRLEVSPAETIYVGDMAVDIHAARAAGIPVWLVPGGAQGREDPLALKPDIVLTGFDRILELLP